MMIINTKKIISIFICLLVTTFISCKKEKEKISYYDDGKSIKSVAYILNGIKNGKEFQYYRNGAIKFEINWLNGRRQGYETEYYLNGNISALRRYKDGIITDTTFFYDETGKKIEEHYYDSIGKLMDFKKFDENGNQREYIAPIVRISSDTINVSDTLYVYVKLGNIVDRRFQTGVLLRGNDFIYNADKIPIYLKDTIEEISTVNNLYKLRIISHQVGINHLRGIIVSHLGDTLYTHGFQYDYIVK